jgi:hypothetical protein
VPSRFHLRLSPVLALLLFTGQLAGAEPYDDFTRAGIDSGRWESSGRGFVQPGDGYLHFAGTGPNSESLVTKQRFSSGVFTLPFRDYACDNNAPAARGLGSIAGFGLGDRQARSWVRLERGQIRPDPQHRLSGGYIETNWVNPDEPGNPIHVNWLPSEISAGFLQIRYDGARVTFFYRSQPTDRWAPVVETTKGGQPLGFSGRPFVVTPGWTTPVPLFINALPGGTPSDRYTLSFKIGAIDISPVPTLDGR